MVIIDSYAVAVGLCLITMLCWGSWANTLKLTPKDWPFPLYYWDYAIGLVLTSLVLGFTLGSTGAEGRSFLADLRQADAGALGSAFLGGVIFNLSNLLIVAATDVAGMAVAFPVAVGLALVIGVVVNYLAAPVGNAALLFGGVALVVAAILVDARAYAKLPSARGASGKGLALSVLSGLLMGFFYRFVAASMITDFRQPQDGAADALLGDARLHRRHPALELPLEHDLHVPAGHRPADQRTASTSRRARRGCTSSASSAASSGASG